MGKYTRDRKIPAMVNLNCSSVEGENEDEKVETLQINNR
jgi:hypothetical protein